MLKTNSRKRAVAAWLALVVFALCFTALFNPPRVFAKGETAQSEDYNLEGKIIGVQTGTTGDSLATEYEKNKTATVERFTKGADAIQALKQKKVDCVVIDEQPAKKFAELNREIRILQKEVSLEEYALCMKKGREDLRDKINAALAKLKENGTIDDISRNYIGMDDERGKYPYKKKDVKRSGTLTVATNAEFPPYEYIDHDKIVGIDMDIMQAICDELGMDMVIENMEFDSILAAVQGGKADVGAAGITVTEDRQKNVDFSDSYTASKLVVLVYDDNPVRGKDDLYGRIIGVQTGTTGDSLVTDEFEKTGKASVERYTKAADAISSLKQNKIDAVIIDEQPAQSFVAKNPELKILSEEFASEDYALCIRKGRDDLLERINTALRKLKQDGTFDNITRNYIGTDDERGKFPYQKKDIERNGTLTVATNAEFPPYEYIDHDKIVGIDMDIMQAICDELGMDMVIENMEFDSILAAVQGGKADVGAAGISVTEERKKNVDFSDAYTTSRQVIVVMDKNSAGSSLSFWERLKQNFVDEDRWKYIADGLGTTLMITGLAVLLGLVLGTLVAVVRTIHDQNGRLKLLNLLCKLYLTIIRGTPAMLQLLIIYYAVFSSVRVSKVLVAVIAFGINSGAYVAEVIRSGINSIDKGQFEAGRCLGLNYRRTMFGIIMPQAFKNMLPALLNEFISLLKETAICGYIGLQDLTKGGDIIRSQTFDAFLPLIAVALVYLVIVIILTRIVTVLERRLKNNERK